MIRQPAPAPPKGYRPHMPLKVKLEACLRALGLEPKDVQFDHEPPLQLRIWCPTSLDTIPPANDARFIVPKGKAEHGIKTAKRDVPAIGKTKRLSREQEAFHARILAKTTGDESPPAKRRKSRIPSRPFRTTRSKP